MCGSKKHFKRNCTKIKKDSERKGTDIKERVNTKRETKEVFEIPSEEQTIIARVSSLSKNKALPFRGKLERVRDSERQNNEFSFGFWERDHSYTARYAGRHSEKRIAQHIFERDFRAAGEMTIGPCEIGFKGR